MSHHQTTEEKKMDLLNEAGFITERLDLVEAKLQALFVKEQRAYIAIGRMTNIFKTRYNIPAIEMADLEAFLDLENHGPESDEERKTQFRAIYTKYLYTKHLEEQIELHQTIITASNERRREIGVEYRALL